MLASQVLPAVDPLRVVAAHVTIGGVETDAVLIAGCFGALFLGSLEGVEASDCTFDGIIPGFEQVGD